MPRYKLTLAYEGTDFHGWQKQEPPGAEPLRTVQGVLEQAVQHVVREPVSVLGASRTDSGVHARGQVATFAAGLVLAPERLRDAINSRLPDDVKVRRAALAPESFNPIGDCTGKGYRYAIVHACRAGGRPVFGRRTVFWTPHRLDPVRMNLAARRLMGTHDFTSLTRLNHGRESTVRTVYDCRVTAASARRIRLDVCGNGFLYNMVRIIAGTLVEVGRGRIEPEAVDGILAARDRAAAGPTLPPEGLCLMWVKYA